MCADWQAAPWQWCRPYPMMTCAQMRAGLELPPTWALEQKAAANRQVIAVMRRRLAAGEDVARMYQEPGLAWLERQAEVAEDLDEEFHHNRLSLIASIGAWGAPHRHALELVDPAVDGRGLGEGEAAPALGVGDLEVPVATAAHRPEPRVAHGRSR
jgi:hypothetical protein